MEEIKSGNEPEIIEMLRKTKTKKKNKTSDIVKIMSLKKAI